MLSAEMTVCIFCFNEESRLERVVKNFLGLCKILVVDNFSTDGTIEVAARLGVDSLKLKNPNFIETPEVMDPLWERITTEYMLIATCSEYVPLNLLKKYAQIANERSFDVVRVFRESVTGGLVIPISGIHSAKAPGELRFYRRGSVDYKGNQVHGRGREICPPDRILKLTEDVNYKFYQFRDYDCSKTERNHANYNDVLGLQWYQNGVRFSWIKALWGSSKQFGNSYIRFGGWRFGVVGFIHCAYRFCMEMGVWFRVWEWQNGFDGASVREKNNQARLELERELSSVVKTNE